MALVAVVIFINITHDNRTTESYQVITGSTSTGLIAKSGSRPADSTYVKLVMNAVIVRNPPDSAVIFSTCPGNSDSLDITIDSYRNLYVTFGQRASNGGNQVIKLMEAARYGSIHRFTVEINLDSLSARLTANGLPVAVAEARPERILDLGRARILVCSSGFPEDSREDGFVGNVLSLELVYGRNSNVSSLRSMTSFVVLAILALVLQLISSKKKR